jgi:cytidylate kinase
MHKKNIAISGLTAAGKTTHAKILAAELGYSYVSATEVMAGMLGIERGEVGPGFWQKYGDVIARVRDTTDLDRELDNRLIAMATSEEQLVIDAWALPWLVQQKACISIWIESDHHSRTLKAAVSDYNKQELAWYGKFIARKDDDTRKRFLEIYGFDLYGTRENFTLEVNNSTYITRATREESDRGIDAFAPVINSSVMSLLTLENRQLHTAKGQDHGKSGRSPAGSRARCYPEGRSSDRK